MASFAAGDVRVEPLMLGQKLASAKMPFADVPGYVAALLQRRSERRFFQRQMLLPVWQAEAAVFRYALAGNPVRNVQPRRILPSH